LKEFKGEGHWVEIIFKGAVPLAIADTASKGANVLLALLVARYFGPKIYGQYATAASVCGLFLIATGIGFEQEFTRRGGRNKESIPDNFLLNLVSIGVTAAITYLGLVLFFLSGVYSREIVVLGILLGCVLVIARFHLPFRHLYLLLGKSHLTAIVQSAATASIVLLAIIVLRFHLTIYWLIVGQLVATLLFTFVWIKMSWVIINKARFNYNKIASFFLDSVPFALSNILWITYFNFDTFMLSLLRSEADVGVYAGVYRILGITYILGYAITNAFTPKLYLAFVRSYKKFSKIATQLFFLTSIIGITIGGFFYCFSYVLIPFIIGESYNSGIIIAQILSFAVFFRLINFGLCEILTTSNRQRVRVWLELIMLMINIAMNLLLIPKYGGSGAALATVAAEFVLAAGVIGFCIKERVFRISIPIREGFAR